MIKFSTFRTINPKPSSMPAVLFYRGGVNLWLGQRFAVLFIPALARGVRS